MTNFDFLLKEKKFASFAEVAVFGGKIVFGRLRRLRAQLPQGDGVCRKVDVFRGRRARRSLSGQPRQPYEHGGFPRHCQRGYPPPHGLYTKSRQRRCTQRQKDFARARKTLPLQSLYFSRFVRLLLCGRIYRAFL